MPEEELGALLPRIVAPPPGPRSRALAAELASVESRNVTYLGEDFPVFWEEARGANVRDVDGNVYVDLTSAFAVASAGHAHPAVVAAVRAQAGRLIHGMGDVHPPRVKVELLRALLEVAPAGMARGILASSGAEAVEAALKTAALASGRPGVLAFEGGYHGLTYGGLAVTSRSDFRAPFRAQLPSFGSLAPYPDPFRPPPGATADDVAAHSLDAVARALDADPEIGAVLAEPVQGRGGDVVPPEGWLRGVRELCDRRGVLLVLDEVYTGFGRTGRWFACQHEGVLPDLMVVGKALGGGLPFAACLGTEAAMDAWPPSDGEAIHTSTFLGNPLACAAALASLRVLREEELVERAAEQGARLLEELRGALAGRPGVGEVRGRGMMIGVELVRPGAAREPDPEAVGRVVVEALRRGWLLLGGGVRRNVLSLSPPFVLTGEQRAGAVAMLGEVVAGGAP
jgi:4-aminobutyrate aminotransferase / (S)-3-amino-2-methylpropionate transaminase / 5-aminovalerate transaminase